MKCFIFVGGSQSNQSGIETEELARFNKLQATLNRTKAELKHVL